MGTKLGAPSKGVIVSDGYAEGKTALGGRLHLNQGAREVGREAFRAFLRRMDRCYGEQLRGIVVMVSADGLRAGAEYVVHGEYKVTDDGLPEAQGQRYVLPGGAFFDIRDGKIARVTNYYNLGDWIAQVGGDA